MFCKKCGQELKDGQRFCGVCGTAVEEMQRKCEKCGAELHDNENFCNQCGTPIPDVSGTTTGSALHSTDKNSSAVDSLKNTVQRIRKKIASNSPTSSKLLERATSSLGLKYCAFALIMALLLIFLYVPTFHLEPDLDWFEKQMNYVPANFKNQFADATAFSLGNPFQNEFIEASVFSESLRNLKGVVTTAFDLLAFFNIVLYALAVWLILKPLVKNDMRKKINFVFPLLLSAFAMVGMILCNFTLKTLQVDIDMLMGLVLKLGFGGVVLLLLCVATFATAFWISRDRMYKGSNNRT